MLFKRGSTHLRMPSNSSIYSRSPSFRSQFVLLINVVLLLFTLPTRVSSSPTPSTLANEQNKINDDTIASQTNAAFMLDAIASEEDLSSPSSSASVQRPLFTSAAAAAPSFLWYSQPRAHANQFLVSQIHDKDIFVPKWFTRYSTDDLDDMDDDLSNRILLKRSTFLRNTAAYPILKKRKQLNKPAMEVMNEIVNSIYL